ncbi:cox cluster protein [Halogeometricum borinquense]|uniref:Cox cluster protein n=2 Tax=Halogeometricum borinquense TaxID=60847 RepID=E4NQT2_HALBP|nr:DUF6684 family protein [Halogeometricum borinquense]ADQ67879.1 hypothetical protein Hbor_23190 [Halogeometricum borinquense DSM 11551]ELY24201.1 hypothetical protein C499_16847 [Halogeometricum borinquense DSM 11551]QIB73511.1 cox cluster protein [Halogeometricum borinquense]QIQ77094.1 cox cluster protein [Halogeometricum borinquense]RYJ13218.1 cox cluster protein [Halogeometricum borinquense]
MANEIFDRETLLDLTVNVIPLVIIAFFIGAFAVFPAFGVDPLASALQYGLLVVPFVFLAILTYLSGKAIAGDEKRSTVYLPGQATVDDPTTLEEYEEKAEAATKSDPELTDGESA